MFARFRRSSTDSPIFGSGRSRSWRLSSTFPGMVADEGSVRWLEPDDVNAVAADVGLAAPVGTVLSRLENEERDSP